ncbi:MAG: hypothetical protein ACD_79C00863G0001, partial [uncultured bacterium]
GYDSNYFYDILFQVIENAFTDAGLTQKEIENTALFLGSTCLEIPVYEEFFEKGKNINRTLSEAGCNYGQIIEKIAGRFNSKAPSYIFSTACTSSANGIIYASSMIEKGFIERALVIGYDMFSHIGFYGFESLKLLSNLPVKPYYQQTDGIIMGEGCGVLVLDSKKINEESFCYLGGANLCDTSNVTSNDTEGMAISGVILNALNNSSLKQTDITCIKSHSTGTYNNYIAEFNGMKKAFIGKVPPVTALKSYIGHTVGASGVIEIIILTECIKQGFIPAALNFENEALTMGIPLLTGNLKVTKGNFMFNYFGFGGNCASIVFSNKE